MKKVMDFIKKYKVEILIVLGAIVSIVGALKTNDVTHGAIYSLVIVIISALIEVLKNGITDSTINLIAKAIEMIAKIIADSKKNDATDVVKAVSAEAPNEFTFNAIREELKKSI